MPIYLGREIDLYRLWKLVKAKGGYQAVTDNRLWRDISKLFQVPTHNHPNVAYGLRQLYQKHILPFDGWREGALLLIASNEKAIHCSPSGLHNLSQGEGIHNESHEASDAEAAISLILLEKASLRSASDDKRKRNTGVIRQKTTRHQGAEAETSELSDDDSRIPENINTLVCELCQGGHHEDKILLCDRCDRGFHIFCLSPPLTSIPEGDWVCPTCRRPVAEKCAFRMGQDMSYSEFEKYANGFKRSYLGWRAKGKEATLEDVESEFWRLVEDADDNVEVLGSQDLDSRIYGSSFPLPSFLAPSSTSSSHPSFIFPTTFTSTSSAAVPLQSSPSQPTPRVPLPPHLVKLSPPPPPPPRDYGFSRWNLWNLPRQSGFYSSLLRHTLSPSDAADASNRPAAYSNVLSPTLSVHMMFSSTCWAINDHCLYTLDFLHPGGEARKWYGVPARSIQRFERVFHNALQEQTTSIPDLIFQQMTMLSPRLLRAGHVPVYGITQNPGEYVVVFPAAYRAVLATGLAISESAVAAPPDWIRFSRAAEIRAAKHRRRMMHPLCHERLVIDAALSDASRLTAVWVLAYLDRLVCRLRR
eukprot:CAMPEP_0175044216 /NCGR_PEP_ID=MMETSP0052_2-20121109/3671_1 /TAXON_ID=51329 ORGANISM="Polytomella parva, Strain SAG 63-3" /NCGR_SAMPLE_ID=MMETSP0052_2 /ASSEMBLY_ACC=CAM_ASM_000194 /LENGTH=585 /DNA_ID=CAMNT_0016307465 /DNA_START=405 /DNA_END=2159 /DNA_ORIENTATION=-